MQYPRRLNSAIFPALKPITNHLKGMHAGMFAISPAGTAPSWLGVAWELVGRGVERTGMSYGRLVVVDVCAA